MKVLLQQTKTGDDWHDIDHIPSRVPFWDENVDFIPYPQFVCFSSQTWIPSPWPALFDGQSKTRCFCLSAMLALSHYKLCSQPTVEIPNMEE